MTNTIKCPTCEHDIQIEIAQLLAGVKFTCINCKSCISLMEESKEKVEEAVNEYKKIKNNQN